jgi:hypothetical protein
VAQPHCTARILRGHGVSDLRESEERIYIDLASARSRNRSHLHPVQQLHAALLQASGLVIRDQGANFGEHGIGNSGTGGATGRCARMRNVSA